MPTKHSKIYNIIIILAIAGLMAPAFSLAEPLKMPETVDDVKVLGEKTLDAGKNNLPGILENVWKNEAVPVWEKMHTWFMNYIYPIIKSQYEKWVKPEVEKRKPVVGEEFEKEKDEMRESVKEEIPSVWQKIKDFFK